ncbi:MAG: hypothetical protein HYX27_02195 [Acidobacteria bacterium]|nr:hypothetical protein [Acidobacteriota bacterium]
MMQDSLGVPVRAHEASQLADLIFQFAEGRTVDDGLRRMLASRASQHPLEGMQVHWGSLAADPVAKSTYFVAVDAKAPVLLHITRSSAPGSGIFPHSVLVGRMYTPRGLEVVVNAIPFAATDAERILAYAGQLDRSVLPSPQGVETLYIAANSDADAAFQQFRAVQRKYGLSVAAWTGKLEEGLWGAIRQGWREGYALRGVEEMTSRERIEAFAMSEPELDERIDALRRLRGRTYDIDLRFDPPGTFTRAEELRGRLERLRTAGRSVQVVEVEIGLRPDAPYPSTVAEMAGWPAEIVSNVQWKAAGKPHAELRQRVDELQQAARQFGAIIGITGYASTSEETLEAIGHGAARRLWFSLGDGLRSDRILDLAAHLRG